jgi:diguanylate cyclase (GGDEF)-like protein
MNILRKLFIKLNIFFETKNKIVLIAWSCFLLLLIGGIDYLLAPEISLSIFYLLPIYFMTWFVSKEAGLVTCVLSAIAWFITNPISKAAKISFLVPYWNAVVMLMFFFTVSHLLFKLRNALEQEKELARIDCTTGLANKRLFFELARLEVKKANRYRHPLTVIYMDVDDFKNINDTLGHQIGDKLLQTAAETIKHSIRETDILARIGGDEFVILLPGSGYEPAHIVIYRVYNELLEAMQENEWPATFSLGAVTFINPPNSVDEMIQQVDHLMYLVKNNGKNQLKHRTSV